MRIVPSAGIAVMSLSVCVKVLMLPLTLIAERWQKEVNQTKTRLQPVLDEIARTSKGEERNRRTLDAYKQHGVSPLYTLKSLLSALVQIPVFFAAYHMLSENVALSGVSFLWIGDLAFPDRLFALPFTIPFFGRHFNLLPFCMTGISLLASWAFSDRTLSPALLRKQRRNLYIMAAAFFLLFYTFPSGMVLYWTMNNVLSLGKAVYGRYRGRAAREPGRTA
jgi:YidC/Oxa1 family membrane protein insertase